MSLAELESEVLKLSPLELSAFTRWLDEYTATQWDDQISQDVLDGRFEKILAKVDADFDAGKCKAL